MLPPVRRVLFYGLPGGVLLVLLKVIEYKHFVRAYPSEIYGGLVAVIFTALGIYFGLRWTRRRGEVVVIREVPVPGGTGLSCSTPGSSRSSDITPREHEILGLIAEGLEQPGDRRAALRLREHGEDPLLPPVRQAGGQPPGPGRPEGRELGLIP